MNKSVLSISLDPSIATGEHADAHTRHLDYSKEFDRFVVIVLNQRNNNLQLTKKGIIKDNYQFKNLYVYLTNVTWKPWMIIKGVYLALKLSSKYRSDTVTAQDLWVTGFIALITSRLRKIPLVVQIHEQVNFQNLPSVLKKWICILVTHSSHIRVVSPQVENDLHQQFQIPLSKITFVPLVVNTKLYFHEKNKNIQIGKILSVNRLIKSKNIDQIIYSFSQEYLKYSKLKLVIAGGGSERESLEKYAHELGNDKTVKFRGSVKQLELIKLYKTSDAFIFASESEGWGNVLIEAALAGLPIITTDVGVAKFWFKHAETARIVSVGDQESLTKELDWVINHPREAYEMAQKAQKLILEKYDSKLLKKQWIQILKNSK